jgi:hypothetical protein
VLSREGDVHAVEHQLVWQQSQCCIAIMGSRMTWINSRGSGAAGLCSCYRVAALLASTQLPPIDHAVCHCCRNGTALPPDMLKALKSCNDDSVSEQAEQEACHVKAVSAVSQSGPAAAASACAMMNGCSSCTVHMRKRLCAAIASVLFAFAVSLVQDLSIYQSSPLHMRNRCVHGLPAMQSHYCQVTFITQDASAMSCTAQKDAGKGNTSPPKGGQKGMHAVTYMTHLSSHPPSAALPHVSGLVASSSLPK